MTDLREKVADMLDVEWGRVPTAEQRGAMLELADAILSLIAEDRRELVDAATPACDCYFTDIPVGMRFNYPAANGSMRQLRAALGKEVGK